MLVKLIITANASFNDKIPDTNMACLFGQIYGISTFVGYLMPNPVLYK